MRTPKNKSHEVQESIKAKVKLIQSILDDPKPYINNEAVRAGLKSQISIASLDYIFENAGKNYISKSISLTTLKNKIFPATGDISFENLERMRIGAIEKLNEAERRLDSPTKRTKRGLRQEVAETEKALETQRENNFHLLQALLYAKTSIESISNLANEKTRDKRAREACQTISNILSLNDYPFNQLERITEHMQHQLKVAK
jgi:hypothetical protein